MGEGRDAFAVAVRLAGLPSSRDGFAAEGKRHVESGWICAGSRGADYVGADSAPGPSCGSRPGGHRRKESQASAATTGTGSCRPTPAPRGERNNDSTVTMAPAERSEG